jgi:Ca2+-binding RTX toxin-like protein
MSDTTSIWRRAIRGAAVLVLPVAAVAAATAVPVGPAGAEPDPGNPGGNPVATTPSGTVPRDMFEVDAGVDCFGDEIDPDTVLYAPDDPYHTSWFYGTEGDDVIIGTPESDWIDGLGGDDVICGYQGSDQVVGGPGADWVDGGGGYDDVIGENGDDHLYGSAGGDAIFGGPGSDRLYGELGGEYLDCGTAGSDNDFADGGEGTEDFVIDCEVFDPGAP